MKAPLSKSKREDVKRLTGQEVLPAIEFEDGSAYREESKDMAATIAAGRLFEKASPGASLRLLKARRLARSARAVRPVDRSQEHGRQGGGQLLSESEGSTPKDAM